MKFIGAGQNIRAGNADVVFGLSQSNSMQWGTIIKRGHIVHVELLTHLMSGLIGEISNEESKVRKMSRECATFSARHFHNGSP